MFSISSTLVKSSITSRIAFVFDKYQEDGL